MINCGHELSQNTSYFMVWCLAGVLTVLLTMKLVISSWNSCLETSLKCLQVQKHEELLSLQAKPNVYLSHYPTSTSDKTKSPGNTPQRWDKHQWSFSTLLPQHVTVSSLAKWYFCNFCDLWSSTFLPTCSVSRWGGMCFYIWKIQWYTIESL